jgi:hypothetical protein
MRDEGLGMSDEELESFPWRSWRFQAAVSRES